MSNRVGLYTAIYPQSLRFAREWRKSVANQSESGFELYISLDQVTREQVFEAAGEEFDAQWLDLRAGSTPAQVRRAAIEFMVERDSHVIFVDSDDVLLPSRVETAIRDLENYDLSGCGLEIVDLHGAGTGVIFGLKPDEEWSELLDQYNVFGLSNTAYRWQVLRHCIRASTACRLLDWRLATHAWATGSRIHFDPTPRMQYRQYGGNTAVVVPPFSGGVVVAATEMVLEHYSGLLEVASALPSWLPDRIRRRARAVYQFWMAINTSRDRLEAYLEALNASTPKYVWWRCVAHPDLEETWKK